MSFLLWIGTKVAMFISTLSSENLRPENEFETIKIIQKDTRAKKKYQKY